MVKAVVEWSKRWSNGQGGSQVVKGQAVTAVQASGVPAAGRPSRTASFDQRSKNRTATFDHWSNALTAERSSRSATAAGRAGALRAAPPPPAQRFTKQTNNVSSSFSRVSRRGSGHGKDPLTWIRRPGQAAKTRCRPLGRAPPTPLLLYGRAAYAPPPLWTGVTAGDGNTQRPSFMAADSGAYAPPLWAR